jgi:predicted permease
MRILLQGLALDVRYGARLLWRSPAFALIAVTSLSVGLGSGIALFTFMNGVLFRPIPGRDTAAIHALYTSDSDGDRYGATSFADFQSFASGAPELFAAACATTIVKGNLDAAGNSQARSGAIVTGSCFETLGIRPHLGRLLNRSDEASTGGPSAIVISHTLWSRAFGANADVVGRGALVNGASAVIVGVAEPGFRGVSLDVGADFWAPPPLARMLVSPSTLTMRGDRRFLVYVRLRDGVTAGQAASRLAGIAAGLRAQDPDAWTETSGSTRTVTVVRELQSRFADDASAVPAIVIGTLGVIAGIVALVCVNVATMTLARGAARTRELSVRLALGASRERLLRQLATESLLISGAGIVAGVMVAAVALRLFEAYRAGGPAFNLALDWRVIGFAVVLAGVAPVLFGVLPGLHALRLAIAEGLKGRPLLIRRRFVRIGQRDLLLAVQLMVSFTLLVATGVFASALRSRESSQADDARGGVAIVPVDLNAAAASDAEIPEIARRILLAADRLPEVDRVTAAAFVPMTGTSIGVGGRLEDRPDAPRIVFDSNVVAPGYFELMDIGRRAGRTFDARDHEGAPPVAIVSESLARRLWNTTIAAGRSLHLDDGMREVVGVVADVPYRSTMDAEHPVLYLPLAQAPPARFVVHARVKDHAAALAALDRAIRDVDARVLVGAAMSLDRLGEKTLTPGRIAQRIGGLAGLLQLGLVLMTTWGLVAYGVERRTGEIAIRRALGATGSSIVGLVMRPALWLLAIGGALGCAAGLVVARALHASFTGLAPLELTSALPVAGLVALVVAAAAWLPARRASSIAPASALREQ